MRCGMCETHVQDVVRKNMTVTRVKASHVKNELVVITENNYIEEDFKNIIDPTGYRITSFERTLAKKTLLGWK